MPSLRYILGVVLTVVVAVMTVITYRHITIHPADTVPREYRRPDRGAKPYPSRVTRTLEDFGAPYRIEALPRRVEGVSYVYVADRERGSVSVINTATDEVTATIDCGSTGVPVALASTRRGAELLVGLEGASAGGLGLIEPVATYRELGVPLRPHCFVFSDEHVFVYDAATSRLVRLSHLGLTSGSAPTPVGWSLPDQCFDMVVGPRGETIYLALHESRKVLAVHMRALATMTSSGSLGEYSPAVEATYDLPGRPCGLAVDRLGSRLFVSLTEGGICSIDVLFGETHQVSSRVANPGCRWLDMAPFGDYAYIANYADGSVSVLDVEAEQIVDTISVGRGPSDVAVTLDYKVYVANTEEGTVSVVE